MSLGRASRHGFTSPADRTLSRGLITCATVLQHERDAKRDDDQIVQIAWNWYEVASEVERTQASESLAVRLWITQSVWLPALRRRLLRHERGGIGASSLERVPTFDTAAMTIGPRGKLSGLGRRCSKSELESG